MSWREFYIPVRTGATIAGYSITHRQYEEAIQYQRMLQDNENRDWQGKFTVELDCIHEPDADYIPTVRLEVSARDIAVVQRLHDGDRPLEFYGGEIEDDPILFTDMMIFYALDDEMPNALSSAEIASVLSEKAGRIWEDVVEAARNDDDYAMP